MMPLAVSSTSILSPELYATIPLWPLIGAIVVGLLLVYRAKPERAHWPVVIGVAVSAVLGVLLFADLASQYRAEGLPAEAGAHTAISSGHGAPGAESAAPAHGDPATAGEEAAAGETPSAQPAYVFHNHGFTQWIYNWISLGMEPAVEHGQPTPEPVGWIAVSLYIDGLTGIMLLFFTVVATVIVIYSIGYMRDHHGHPEPGYPRFFAFLGLFVFSMATLVMAGNFVLLYLGWEAVGLCSYLLIGFYFRRPSAAAAAKKAFIVNRIGDFGFALGIFSLYMYMRGLLQPGENPLDYEIVFKYFGVIAHQSSGILGLTKADVVGLLLMCGAVGKSAQFPLYVWLPDAMEGPTPVSALIHAATMVTAGIYMIARCTPIFMESQVALDTILVLGTIGAFLTATMAMTQYDMKRILAYSTISQLAFMFVALGCSAPEAGVFHVFTHAWFKALLFLGAGSVMHQMGGIIDLRKFSGLRHILPQTYWTMLAGCLALAGFPLLAGFWSKDEIVHAAFERNTAVGIIMLVTAFLTAYYTFRMFYLCFHGKLRLPDEAGEHPHESPKVMTVPLWILAFGAIFAGYMGVWPHVSDSSFLGVLSPHGYIHSYLEHSTINPRALVSHAVVATEAEGPAEGSAVMMYVSAVVALVGIGLAWLRFRTAPRDDPDHRLLGPIWVLWNRKWYVDELYDRVIVRPLRDLGYALYTIDRYGVDGIVWFVSAVPRALAFLLHFFQRGALQGYAVGMALGLVVVVIIWIFV